MPAKIYYDQDADLGLLKGRKIAIIGYGSQGHAHALNLKDSGQDVVVGLYKGSKSWAKAEKDGLRVASVNEAAQQASVIMILLPDQSQRQVFESEIKGGLGRGKMLMFAHGFNIHFNQVVPPPDVDVTMIAPKAPGHVMRDLFTQGPGVPALLAVFQDVSGRARDTALAYGKGVGCTRAGVIETTFKEETETDLFGEQTTLGGGISHLIKAAFETLVEVRDPATESRLLTEEICFGLFFERGYDHSRPGTSHALAVGERRVPGPAGDVLEDGEQRGDAVPLGEEVAHHVAGSLGRDHRHVHVRRRHHLVEVDVEAMGEHEHLAPAEPALDLALEHLTLALVGQQDHNHARLLGGLVDGRHAQPVLLGLRPALRALVEPDHDVLTGVLEIQRVGVPLAAVADDRDLPALEQAEVGVRVVVDFRRHP